MKTILYLNQRTHNWESIRGKIPCKNIHLTNFNDVKPFVGSAIFPDVENIFMDSCDGNFVNYWVNWLTFPNAKNLYLKSHFSDPKVLSQKFKSINVHEDFKTYADHWPRSNARIITDAEYDQAVNSFTEIPPYKFNIFSIEQE